MPNLIVSKDINQMETEKDSQKAKTMYLDST